MWSRKMRALTASLLVAAMMAASVTAATPAHASNIHTVNDFGDQPDTNPGDGVCNANTGPATQGCTLRAAIQEANDNPGADRINFNLPFLAPIQPRSQLPNIRNQTTIDGYTQPGASPNTLTQGDNAQIKVELNGRFAGSANGLVFQQSVFSDNPSNSIVQGLAINNFAGDGIAIFGGVGIRIEGNFIGTDTSGTQDQGNGQNGVTIREGVGSGPGGAHVVGDGTSASRNVISGNGSEGVLIGFGPSNNKVKGNYIGTDRDGTDDLTNDDLGNDGAGVGLRDTNDNEIGGSTAGSGNVISNNDSGGLILSGDATGNEVLGNRIGTDRTGNKNLGNGLRGVLLLGVADNFIGDGTAAGANTIAFSDRAGVDVQEEGGEPGGANGNRILSNSIFSNGDFFEPGITLSNGSVTPNDGDNPNTPQVDPDSDVGPNNLQNKPVITSAKNTSTATTIAAKLNSTPGKTYRVQFFSNPSGGDEGKKFIGQKSVTTDASGNVSFTFQPASKVTAGRTVTATATKTSTGDTSEFSAPRTVALSSGSALAPDTTKVSGPSGITKSPAAHFKFTSPDPDATFECSLDGGDYYSCSSPENIHGLSEGRHTFEVRARDGDGVDPSPAAWIWAVGRNK